MDVCKIAPQLYQYTAIDDRTRVKVVGLYPNKKAHSTLAFLEQVIETFPYSHAAAADRQRRKIIWLMPCSSAEWPCTSSFVPQNLIAGTQSPGVVPLISTARWSELKGQTWRSFTAR